MLKVVGLGPSIVRAKIVGRESATATMASMEAFTPAMVAEKLWVPFLRPPSRRLAPSTKRTLPMIEPMMEAFTTVVRPAARAKTVMMSSAALPKVALRMPPMRGPAWVPRLSVACPRTHARPMRASEVSAKMSRIGACKSSTATTATVSTAVTP
jgi:hypothetical protein